MHPRTHMALHLCRFAVERLQTLLRAPLGLRQAELGVTVAEVCRKMGISEATFYRWKQIYGGMGPSELRKMRQLEEENQKLKRLVADLSLDKAMLQEVLAKKV